MAEEMQMTGGEALRVLEDFVLDKEVLAELEPYLSEINIFDVLKLKEHEIRHSNVLAWLLDPKGSHGLGDAFTRLFISRVISRNRSVPGLDVMKWSYLNLSDCEIQREKHWPDTGTRDSLDILLMAYQPAGLDYLIAVENKVRSSEGPDQTARYRAHLEAENPASVKMLVYLTARDEEPGDERWATLSYRDIYEILGHILKHKAMSPEAELILDNYRKVCADVMGIYDAELREKVKKIYREHKAAIDLINRYKPDLQWDIADYLSGKLDDLRNREIYLQREAGIPDGVGNIGFPVNAQKSYIRFTTHTMDSYIRPFDEASSCWNTYDNYCYEFSFTRNGDKMSVSFKMLLNVKDLSPDSEQYLRGSGIMERSGYRGKSGEKKHFRVAFAPLRSAAFSADSEIDELKPMLDDYFAKVMKKIDEIESEFTAPPQLAVLRKQEKN